MGARGNSLTGTIVDGRGQPVPFAWVAIGTDEDSRESISGTLQIPGDAQRSKVMDLEGILLRADASGRFATHEVPSGFVLIVARESGRNASLVGTHHYWQTAGLKADIQVILYRGATVFGVVKDSTGKPIPHLTVEVEWEGLPELGQFEDDLGPFVSDRFVTTNEQGEYAIEGLLAGDVDLQLTGQRRRLNRTETILISGQRFRWDPVVKRIASLEVQLSDEQGRKLEGWGIEASGTRRDRNDGISRYLTTDVHGKRILRHLDPNETYMIRLFAPLANEVFARRPITIRTDVRGDQGILQIVLTNDEMSGQKTK
ncbi:MAG: carboxypeptidase regulatory-like domain-containing protein [Planctomycetes bacterium]|nr:carboxypeptidase regulatory-like domain-containing protein [Planctomycetota bacterium]